MLSFLKRKPTPLLSDEANHLVVKAIQHAEERTSGEIRVYVESRCRFVDAIDRAAEIFGKLQMEKTEQRNAVLVYIALKDRQLAIFGDEGIHQRVGEAYWKERVADMVRTFNREDYAKGIAECVIQVGEALHHHFPYDKNTDKNELPDTIVFGR